MNLIGKLVEQKTTCLHMKTEQDVLYLGSKNEVFTIVGAVQKKNDAGKTYRRYMFMTYDNKVVTKYIPTGCLRMFFDVM